MGGQCLVEAASFGEDRGVGTVGGLGASSRSDEVEVLVAAPALSRGRSHVVCQAAVGQVVGAPAQVKRCGNVPSHWMTPSAVPQPWRQWTSSADAGTAHSDPRSLNCRDSSGATASQLRVWGRGDGGSGQEQTPQGTPASLVDLAVAALEQ